MEKNKKISISIYGCLRYWYMLLVAFPFGLFNWIAFLYVGIITKRRRYYLYGAGYFMPIIVGMVLADGQGKMPDFIIFAMVILWIVSIIHVFNTRKIITVGHD